MNIKNQVQGIITDELTKAGVKLIWNMDELHVLPDSKTVIEYTSSSGSLSQALTNHYFPPVSGTSRLAHFTKLDNFKSILTSRSLRLYSLLKRVNEQEFKPFSEDFGLTGYLDKTDGEPYYKTLMGDLFYTSFTNPNPTDEQYLWNTFGAGGRGVKIIFEVTVIQSYSELRPVIYQTKSQAAASLIKQIVGRIKNECNRYFIMRGISRIGAFYLPLGYNLETEEETRLLIKSWGEGPAYDLIEGSGPKAFIPLELGQSGNQFCTLNIVEVQIGSNCDKDEVVKLLNNSGFSNVQVKAA